MKGLLLSSILSLSPLWASVVGDIEFSDSLSDVKKKLQDIPSLLPIVDAAGASKLQRSHKTADRLAYQDWTVSFNFDSRGKELLSVYYEGSEPFSLDQFQGPLKSYYLYVVDAVKDKYFLEDRSLNTPNFMPNEEVYTGKIYPVHSYASGDREITITLRYDKKADSIYVGYMISPAQVEREAMTAMGSARGSYSNDGADAAIWRDIPKWEGIKEAEEFLIRNGLKEAPKPVEIVEGGGTEKPAEPVKPEIPVDPALADLDLLDKNLNEPDAKLLKGAVHRKHSQGKEAFNSFVAAATANKGDARAFFNLAECYESGIGTEQDIDKSANAYLMAAQLGYAPALVRYGYEFKTALNELGFSEDEGKEILDILHTEAAAGRVWARFNLALMYRYGYGLRKDVEKGRSLMSQLAKQGDPVAKKLIESGF